MTGWMETQRAIVTEDDCDFNKHMSVKGYFRMFDDAAFYLLSSAGLFYGNLHARNLALATVVQRIRYLAELAESDRYVIESAYARNRPPQPPLPAQDAEGRDRRGQRRLRCDRGPVRLHRAQVGAVAR